MKAWREARGDEPAAFLLVAYPVRSGILLYRNMPDSTMGPPVPQAAPLRAVAGASG